MMRGLFSGGLAAALLVTACGSSKDENAGASPTGGAGGENGDAGGGAMGGSDAGLIPRSCEGLDELVTIEALERHARALQKAADDNGGNRAAATPGNDASAAYVGSVLESAGVSSSSQMFDFADSQILGPGLFEVTLPTPRSLQPPNSFFFPEQDPNGEFTPVSGSRPADVTAELVAVDLDLGPGNQSTSGCEAADFLDGGGQSLVTGKIALLQRGECFFADKMQNAQTAGAVGAIIFNQGDAPDRRALLAGSIGEGAVDHGILIPGVITTSDVGEELAAALTMGPVEARVVTDTIYRIAQTRNVVAEIPGETADEVLMLGAHLDSVAAGPGINDNGSGSSALLEIATQLGGCAPPRRTMRFAWWGAEENGLLGSEAYVAALSATDRDRMVGYINMDMIASPNFVFAVGDGDGSTGGELGPPGSEQFEAFFLEDFGSRNIPLLDAPFHFRSDYAPFVVAGIPIGDISTGADGVKSTGQTDLFGGVPNEQHDQCYHQACDTIDNLNLEAFEIMAKSIARAASHFGIEGNGLSASALWLSPQNARSASRPLAHETTLSRGVHPATASCRHDAELQLR